MAAFGYVRMLRRNGLVGSARGAGDGHGIGGLGAAASKGDLLGWADKAFGQMGIANVTKSVLNLLSGARQVHLLLAAPCHDARMASASSGVHKDGGGLQGQGEVVGHGQRHQERARTAVGRTRGLPGAIPVGLAVLDLLLGAWQMRLVLLNAMPVVLTAAFRAP